MASNTVTIDRETFNHIKRLVLNAKGRAGDVRYARKVENMKASARIAEEDAKEAFKALLEVGRQYKAKAGRQPRTI